MIIFLLSVSFDREYKISDGRFWKEKWKGEDLEAVSSNESF